jgi:hypothetical protein
MEGKMKIMFVMMKKGGLNSSTVWRRWNIMGEEGKKKLRSPLTASPGRGKVGLQAPQKRRCMGMRQSDFISTTINQSCRPINYSCFSSLPGHYPTSVVAHEHISYFTSRIICIFHWRVNLRTDYVSFYCESLYNVYIENLHRKYYVLIFNWA